MNADAATEGQIWTHEGWSFRVVSARRHYVVLARCKPETGELWNGVAPFGVKRTRLAFKYEYSGEWKGGDK